MTLKNIKDYIENKLENTQWIVDVIINNETKSVDVNLEIYSPAGRDVCVEFTFEEGTTKKQIHSEFESYYESYDVSYETYLWLDEDGHGKNGAPYEMEKVLIDTQWVENELSELAYIFSK
jgi:hypothetical protein